MSEQHLSKERVWLVQQVFKMPSINEIQAERKKRNQFLIDEDKYRVVLERKRNKWKALAVRLYYLQKVQLGHNSQDPANLLECHHPASKQILIIQSNYLFSILQLLIGDPTNPEELNGFKIIKEKSIERKREFPFESPRQLFVGICHSMAVHDFLLDISTEPTDQLRKHKGGRRKHSTLEQKLMDGRLEPKEEKELLEKKLKSGLFEFWYAAIHPHRYKTPIKPYFQKFRKAHKEMKKLFNSKPIEGAWLTYGIRNRNGNFIDPESMGILPEA
ncbi:hypothetical protein [Acaryochloris sp. IP29b_bin.148]|uniref:hypothetical protein n=1 Tax=Acaryochloris sp. IP29b_bin.148 TaxID=2969218 RepID=UPI00260AE566|nr:hypothetical protein [Acaryochloris sp. IP29b_bin.148]